MKHDEFVNGMRKAGKVAAQTLEYALSLVSADISTEEIDRAVHEFILSKNAIPAPLNYKGFPKSTCISINEILCHGVPDSTKLAIGDILNIDVTVVVNGYFGDTSATVAVIGGIDPSEGNLIKAAREARDAGIRMIRPYGTTGDIGMASAAAAASFGLTVAPNLGGHGIGKDFHMAPHIPSAGQFGLGEMLRPWTCITVEPIVVSNPNYETHKIPGSTIEWYTTVDKSPAAQFEHTILITDKGYEILTEL
jgi:methionyl aminopeptidase